MLNLVCFLEEPSAENLIKFLARELFTDSVYCNCIVFQGKQDLEKNIENRLKHYLVPNTVFLVMRDQDSGDCKAIKQTLKEKVNAANRGDKTCIRIACRELESFFLGDLAAVGKGLEINGLESKQNKRQYRNPDQLNNAAKELKDITKNKYQKMAGSRDIAPHLDLSGKNKSTSFNMLVTGLKQLVSNHQ